MDFVDPWGLVLTGLHALSRDMTLDQAVAVGDVGNGTMTVVATGAPFVAAGSAGFIVLGEAAAGLTLQQIRELIAAGLIAFSKNTTIASKSPSLPTQTRPAIQRLIQQMKESSKMPTPKVTRKVPGAFSPVITSPNEKKSCP